MTSSERSKPRRFMRWLDAALVKTYGEPQWRATGKPLEGLVAAILSQNTSDTNSRRAYEALRAAFPAWEDVLEAPRTHLEKVLRPGGLAKTKSARIQRILKSIAETGTLSIESVKQMTGENAEAFLLAFEGVGYKTARCVLMFDLGRDVFPIDTHVYRVLKRIGIIPREMTVDRAHEYVPRFIEKGRCYALHVNLVRHGKQRCRPRNPECGDCPLRRRCSYFAAASDNP